MPGHVEDCVAALPPAAVIGMPAGFRGLTPQSRPLVDYWFIGRECETHEAVMQVQQERLWVQDAHSRHCGLVILHAEVNLLGNGLALGWVQVQCEAAFNTAFDALLSSQPE
jgi:hypothetical protein